VAPFRAPGHAGQPGAAHQQRDGVVADDDAVAKAQLGMHTQGAIGAARILVQLDDQVGQPGVADRPLGWWPGPPGVLARGRHVQDLAGDLHWNAFGGLTATAWNRLLGHHSRTSSIARRMARSSVSSSAMRPLAAASSLFSGLVRPGSKPRSMRSCRRQVAIDWALISSAWATSAIGRPASTRSRTLRRNSGG
jgi:hypothetical protein